MFRSNVPLAPFTTLKAGGPAEFFAVVRNVDLLAVIAVQLQQNSKPMITLGSGSNVLPSDAGVPGVTAINLCSKIEVNQDGTVVADCGAAFQDVFLKCTQAGLAGFEFAVGIPGTLGGALVSNAGAYRNNVSAFLRRLEVVMEGERKWVDPTVMHFAYRDSILRTDSPPPCALLRAEFVLPRGDRKKSFDEAREFQRQRISKQPAPASAGSFFKNVNDKKLAESLPKLAPSLKEAGVVPAGHLIEHAGLKGFAVGRARMASRHANFVLNTGGATASNIRDLAEHVKARVMEVFGVALEEEVLYIGDWSKYKG